MCADSGQGRKLRYLGVHAVAEKGKTHWVARVFNTELGRTKSPEAAAEIVRQIGQAKSIKELEIPASVPSPQSVARYKGVYWRKPGARSKGGWWVGKKNFFKSFRRALQYAAESHGVTQEKLRRRVSPKELGARLRALTATLSPVPADLQVAYECRVIQLQVQPIKI